jgi:hypothetical protein
MGVFPAPATGGELWDRVQSINKLNYFDKYPTPPKRGRRMTKKGVDFFIANSTDTNAVKTFVCKQLFAH